MVLPTRAAGTGDWSEAQLAAIAREGDMIGVTVRENATIVSSTRTSRLHRTNSRATTRHPARTAIDVVLCQRKRIASAHLDLDMRTSGSSQQVGRWLAAQHVSRRATQYVPRLAMQDVTRRWRWIVTARGDGGHAHWQVDVSLTADAFGHPGASRDVDRQRQNRHRRNRHRRGRHMCGRDGCSRARRGSRRTVRWLRCHQASERQKQGNHQPHAATLAAPG